MRVSVNALLKNVNDNVQGKVEVQSRDVCVSVCIHLCVRECLDITVIIQSKSSEAIQSLCLLAQSRLYYLHYNHVKIASSAKSHQKILDVLLMPFALQKHYPFDAMSS